jgi:hypothetical protein
MSDLPNFANDDEMGAWLQLNESATNSFPITNDLEISTDLAVTLTGRVSSLYSSTHAATAASAASAVTSDQNKTVPVGV